MTTPEELRSLADCLQCKSENFYTTVELEEAATALRAYADSLERAEPVARIERVENSTEHRLVWLSEPVHGATLYIHPARYEPPKMTEAEIRSVRDECEHDDPDGRVMLIEFGTRVAAARDKQWRAND